MVRIGYLTGDECKRDMLDAGEVIYEIPEWFQRKVGVIYMKKSSGWQDGGECTWLVQSTK